LGCAQLRVKDETCATYPTRGIIHDDELSRTRIPEIVVHLETLRCAPKNILIPARKLGRQRRNGSDIFGKMGCPISVRLF
jgi:hypothetical protein